MGRKRKRQAQSSRIYLREHDHREVIMDDTYHNAIYIGQEVEPAWRKYKKLSILGLYPTNSWGDRNVFISIDAENKFVHAYFNYGYYTSVDMFYTKDFVSITESLSSGTSKNGYDYKLTDFEQDGYEYSAYRGRSGLNTYGTSGSNLQGTEFGVINYEFHHEKDALWNTISSKGVSYFDIYAVTEKQASEFNGTYRFRGYGENGIFFSIYKTTTEKDASGQTVYVRDYYLIFGGAGCPTLMAENEIHRASSQSDFVFAIEGIQGYQYHNGTFASPYSIRTKIGVTENIVEVWYGNDNSYDFTNRLLHQNVCSLYNERATSNSNFKVYTRYRSGYWYFYIQKIANSKIEWLCYRSRLQADSGVGEEVILPSYVELDFLDDTENHGCIQTPSEKKLRIVLNENDETSQSDPNNEYIICTLVFNQEYSFNCAVEDGEIADDPTREYLCGYLQDSNGETYAYYFDNMNFTVNDNCFAFQLNSSYEYEPEIVQDDDYVNGN